MGDLTWQFEALHSGYFLRAASCICGAMLLACSVILWRCKNRSLAGFALMGAVFSIFAFGFLKRYLPAALFVQVLWTITVFYRQSYAKLGRSRFACLLGLRIIVVIVVFSALFKPALLSVTTKTDSKPKLAVLLDNSASMSVTDSLKANRFNRALTAIDSITPHLEKSFNLQWFTFAKSIKQAENFQQLTKVSLTDDNAQSTDLGAAIRNLNSEAASQNRPAVLVLSDGNYTRPQHTSLTARESQLALYCAAVGSEKAVSKSQADISIQSVQAPFDAPRNTNTSIVVKIQNSNPIHQQTEIKLTDTQTNKTLTSQTVEFKPGLQTQTVKLQYKPDIPTNVQSPDIRKLKIAIQNSDRNPQNNTADLHILVTNPQLRVLYIEGAMRPEYKFLKRALESDPNIQFASLIRWSKNHFSSYGQLEGKKLLTLPTAKEDFDLFDILILGDIDRTFLQQGSAARLERIKEFVENGGALVMLGGLNSFGPGGYSQTPIESVLPVITGPRKIGQQNAPFIPKLTAEGLRHPILEGIKDYFPAPARSAAKKIPELEGCVITQKPKPSSQVLMVHPQRTNAGGPLTVLAVNPVVGKGRSAAFTCDTTWRWYMQMKSQGKQSPYYRFWGQLIRWLGRIATKDDSEKPYIVLRTKKQFIQAGENLSVIARTNQKDAQVIGQLINTETQNKKSIPLSLDRTNNIWSDSIASENPGQYKLEVLAISPGSQKVLAKDSLDLIVHKQSKELEKTARNDAALKHLAEITNGKFAPLKNIDTLADNLIQLASTLGKTKITTSKYNLYNFPATLLIVVILLTAEWIIRRRWMLS